ncbi:MAG: tetratricopeptide repeat protein [Candidatus Poribacteria bacterium]|nr:tetratricopeptide repeat protein [Candidatus Poribacteria bacterium]
MNNQYRYSGRPLTPRIAQELIQELFAGQTVQRQELVKAVDEAHLARGGQPKRSKLHPVERALTAMKRTGLAENPRHGFWFIPIASTGVNNQYQYSEQPLTAGIAQELIQELFEGQTVQKQEIANAVDNTHLERGGLASEDPVTTALTAMKRSGLAENQESDLWSIISQTEDRIRISTLDEFTKWAAQFDSGEGSEQYLFRGVSSADYKIDASAYRRIKKERNSDERQEGDFEKFLQINKDLIRDARFRGHDRKNGRKLKDLEVLAEFQHYGAATFLMDFTYNALVALWFACKESSKDSSKDGKVVAVPPNDPKFIGRTGEFSIITLDSLGKKIDQLSLNNKQLYQWQPRTQNERIIAQQSIFLFGVLEIEINPDEECIIKGSSKEKIQESLKRIYGITEDMLFPDFDGFARQYSQDRSYTQPTSTIQYHERADEAFQRGEYEEAISNYSRAIELDRNDVIAYCNRGIAKSQLGQDQAAISDFDEAIHRGDNDAYTYFLRGISKYTLEQYTAAIDDYDEAIRRDPEQVSYTYRWRGFAKSALGQHTSAIDDYNEALLQNPDNAHDYFMRGISKYALEQYSAAVDDFDEAIRLDPNHTEAYYQRGLVKCSLDQYESAINDYDETISINPNHAEAYYQRAEANFYLHRFAEAKNNLQSALSLVDQIDNADLIDQIDYLLYEINSRTAGEPEDE